MSGAPIYESVEFGVMCDHTSHGVGVSLVKTAISLEGAQAALRNWEIERDEIVERTGIGCRCPLSVQARTVVRGDWYDLELMHSHERRSS
jgi:hypothetical protein